MKTIKRLLSAFNLMLFLSVFASCDKSDLMDPETDPVSNVVNE